MVRFLHSILCSKSMKVHKVKLCIIFTFFCINRRKYWFRAKFRLPVFDGFKLLGCSEHDLIISGKCQSVCVCKKHFVASVARELLIKIS